MITKNKIKSLIEDVNIISKNNYKLYKDQCGYSILNESNEPLASCLKTKEAYEFIRGYYYALLKEI